MDIFNVLSLIGGLSLFLFGMNLMGEALERSAGGKLRSVLDRMTTGRLAGLFTGLAVTAMIQSSSATTVMVVGFVNSGLMSLKQAINVIMGANIGTTVTAWILSLAGISSSNIFMMLLKPTSFTPILALLGVFFYSFSKNNKRKDLGMIFLGFATLMFGMETMTTAVVGLKNVPEFQKLFLLFNNPLLGVIAGAVLTAIIQSSSASVGILQALASTGQVTYGSAIPIIMGQNIGTCVTAIISSAGANKNAKRAAMLHLSFNIIGSLICLFIFYGIEELIRPAILFQPTSLWGIAVSHTVFNLLCVVFLFPFANLLEKLVLYLVPDDHKDEVSIELDERLFFTPPIALERAGEVANHMADISINALISSLTLIDNYDEQLIQEIKSKEKRADYYEDILGTYLVRLSSRQISPGDATEATKLLKIIGDFERISDHAVNIVDSAVELHDKNIVLSDKAQGELHILIAAVKEISELALQSFFNNDVKVAALVDPLEEVIDKLKELLRMNHIIRLQNERCSIEAGFVWADLLTNLERVSDHCSNIAGCIIDMAHGNLDLHESLRTIKREDVSYRLKYEEYLKHYYITKEQA